MSHSILPLTPHLTPVRPVVALLLSVLSLLALGGCASNYQDLPPVPNRVAYRLGSVPADDVAKARAHIEGGNRVYWWDENANPGGSPRLIVNLPEQKVFAYKGGQLIGASTVSTGREGYDTPTGKYTVISKHRDHRSNLYGNYVDAGTGAVVKQNIDTRKDPAPPGTVYKGSRMPYFTRLRHHAGGSTAMGFHEGYLPGYAASHGCLRLPRYFAKQVFDHVPNGSSVLVENAAPDKSAPGIPFEPIRSRDSFSRNPGYYTEYGARNQPSMLPNDYAPSVRGPQAQATRDTSGRAIPIF
jgi:hypothetical protein